jgi:hypothetical protein
MASESGDERAGLMNNLRQLAAAAGLVAQGGTEAQIKEAARILTEGRKALYGVLAEDDPAQEG